MRQLVGTVLLLLFSGAAQPADDVQLQRLQSALDAVRQEQQSVYQQFQMTEALNRTAIQRSEAGTLPNYVPDGQAPNYDDAVRARRELQNRLDYYSEELRQLSARYKDLEIESRSLVDQIRELAQRTR